MLLTLPGAADTPVTGTVTGRLLPLGVDLSEHATAAAAQVHAVLEPADGTMPRLVLASVSAPKPDTVVGIGVWPLLRPHMSLLAAVSQGRSMDLADMPVTAGGDLIWSDSRARPSEPADPFATARVALPTATGAAIAPLDRHPARIAVPVFLEGYAARKDGDEGASRCQVVCARRVRQPATKQLGIGSREDRSAQRFLEQHPRFHDLRHIRGRQQGSRIQS